MAVNTPSHYPQTPADGNWGGHPHDNQGHAPGDNDYNPETNYGSDYGYARPGGNTGHGPPNHGYTPQERGFN